MTDSPSFTDSSAQTEVGGARLPTASISAGLASTSGVKAAADWSAAAAPAISGYEILGELGRGGMGVVYKARQISLDRTVALKMVLGGASADKDDLARFRSEAEAVARLTHPNIIQIHEIGEHAGRPFVALEYLEGGTLGQAANGKPLPNRRAAEVALALARAVDHAHGRSILHRDLKPSNVLLAADGTLKLTDFGLAKRLDGDVGRTRTGHIVGSPSYMAPEQAMAESHRMGPATDVWGLGAILYELLTGRPPFRAETAMDTLRQVVDGDPAAPRTLNAAADRDLENICLQCLEKEPGRRYRSAGALADDLQRWLRGDSVSARSAGMLDRLGRALDRDGQSGEFAAWAGMSFWFAAVVLAEHIAMFALIQSERPEWHYWTPRLGLYACLGLIFWSYYPRKRTPGGSAERQMISTWVGYFAAAALAAVCVRLMVPELEQPRRELVRYPIWALLIGLCFFSMGAGFWGRCYAFGAGFLGLAVVMSAATEWAPLIFGAALAVCLTMIGFHLRRLSRQPD